MMKQLISILLLSVLSIGPLAAHSNSVTSPTINDICHRPKKSDNTLRIESPKLGQLVAGSMVTVKLKLGRSIDEQSRRVWLNGKNVTERFSRGKCRADHCEEKATLLPGTAGQIADRGIQETTSVGFLKMSRSDEKQADLEGTGILYDAGYDPHAISQFFAVSGGFPADVADVSSHTPQPHRAVLKASVTNNYEGDVHEESSTKYNSAGRCVGGGLGAFAADIVIPVNGPVSQRKVMFQCDEHAKILGLPSGPFTVTYVNGENNWLAVLPMNGHPVIFARVMSADGSRYAADRFVWWDVGSRGVHLYADGLNKEQTACHVVH